MNGARQARWRPQGQTAGRGSRVLAAAILLGLACWVGWPLWSPATAPDLADQRSVAAWVMGAIICALCCLAVVLWLESGRRSEVFAPLVAMSLVGLLVRALFTPAVLGFDPSFVVATITGMVLGGPSGLLSAAAIGLGGALLTNSVDATLPALLLAHCCWGVAGGMLRQAPIRLAIVAGIPLMLGLGLLTEALASLPGWVDDHRAQIGGFEAGLAPAQSVLCWWAYAWAGSAWGIGLLRGVLNAAVLLACVPLVGALRSGFDNRAGVPVPRWPRPTINASAIARRIRSDRLASLWDTPIEQPSQSAPHPINHIEEPS